MQQKKLLQFTVCIGLDPACNATEPVQRIVMENSDLTVLCQLDIKLNSIVEAGSSLEGSNRIFRNEMTGRMISPMGKFYILVLFHFFFPGSSWKYGKKIESDHKACDQDNDSSCKQRLWNKYNK